MGDLTNWKIDYKDTKSMFINGYTFNGYSYVPKYYIEYILG